jgi:RNA polymerase sigma-70 factor (ECF subfamily)
MQDSVNIENIWVKIHEKLFEYISKHVKNKDDVNDIIQDTFIKATTNIASLKNPAKADKWIFQIARNTMNDFFRKQKKSFTEEKSKDVPIEPNAFGDQDIKVKIQTQEFSDYAGFIISELPEKYKRAVYLADIEGLSMKKLAQELDLSVSGAKSRVQRGRKLIKEIILKCCEVNADKYGNILDYEPLNNKYNKKC